MRALIETLNARFSTAASGRNVLLVLIAALLVFSLFNSWLVPAFQAATNGMYPIDRVMPTTPSVIYDNYKYGSDYVPEPSSFILLASCGLLALGFGRLRKR